MRFALLLYLDPVAARQTSGQDAAGELAAYAAIADELAERGVLRGGEAFMPARMGTVVRVDGGERTTAPAEPADPELSGFLLVDTEPEDALDIAATLPVAAHGVVEVRPVMDFPDSSPS